MTMESQRKIFAIVSVIFLLILAIAPFKGFFPGWRSYQNRYNDLIASLPQRIKPVEIGIKQIWVQSLNRIDRCTTCHLGIKEPALANAPQPFRQHPNMRHNVEEYGCTSCHGGNGSATEVKEAHGQSEFWEEPILPAKY